MGLGFASAKERLRNVLVARADQADSVPLHQRQIGCGRHAVRHDGIKLLKGTKTDDGGVTELALVRHQDDPVSPLDDVAFDLRLQIGAVGQTIFNSDAGGGDENGLDAQMGKGVQCGDAGKRGGGGGVDAA